jgi:hypothetical protein
MVTIMTASIEVNEVVQTWDRLIRRVLGYLEPRGTGAAARIEVERLLSQSIFQVLAAVPRRRDTPEPTCAVGVGGR